MPAPLRWTLRIALCLAALLVLAVALLAVALGTPAGRDFAVAQAERFVSGLDIAGVTGSLFDLRAERLTVTDAQGPWLTVEDWRLAWSPLALLTRTIAIDTLTAARIEVARRPVPAATPAATEAEEGDPTPARRFRLPVAVDVDRLDLPRIELGPQLLGGQPAALSAQGSLSLPSGEPGGSADLEIARIDDQPGFATIQATFVPGRRLDLNVQAAEPEGGVVAGLLGIDGRPPVIFSLNGSGSLTDWTGTLESRVGEGETPLARALAEARIVRDGDVYTVGLDVDAAIAALLPAPAAALAGPDVTLSAALRYDPAAAATLERLELVTASGVLTADGRLMLGDNALDLSFAVDAGADSALHTVLAEPVFQSVRLTGTATGPATAPRIDATLTAADPAWRRVAADRLDLDLTAVPEEGFARIAVDLKTVLTGLAATDPALAPVAGREALLTAKAVVVPDGGVVRLDALALDTAALDAAGTADMAGWGETANARLTLTAPSLKPLSRLAGRDLAGAVEGVVTATRSAGATEVSLDAAATKLVTGTPAADTLLAPRTTVRATAQLGADGSLRLPALAVASPRLAAQGNAHLVADRLQATLAATLPELAPVGEALGTPLAGAGQVAVTLSGPPDALAATVLVTSDGVRVSGTAVAALDLGLVATGLPEAPDAKLTGTATVAGQPARLEGGFALKAGRLTVPALDLAIGRNTLAVTDLSTVLAQGPATANATGTVVAKLPDLATLGALAGERLAGAATATLRLDGGGDGQSVNIDAEIAQLVRRTPDGDQQVQRLAVTGRVGDLRGTPRLDLTLTGQGLETGATALDRFTATADGPLTGAKLTLEASGSSQGRPIALATSATLGRSDTLTTVALDRLTARLDGEQLALDGPATLAFGPETVQVTGLDLRSGTARLALTADLGPDSLAAEATLSSLPLSLVRLIDPVLPLQGSLEGTATLAGTREDPRGSLKLTATGVRLGDAPAAAGAAARAADAALPPLDATVTGDWTGGRLALKAQVEATGPAEDDRVLTAVADLPLILTGAPLALAVPEDRPVSAKLAGSLQLARLNDLLAASGDRVRGTARIDLALGGTLADRTLAGQVRVVDAAYENAALGTVISGIDADLVGDPQGLTIRSFTGRTGGDGRLEATGQVRFDPPEGEPAIDLRLLADQARVAQTDLITASANADLSLTGSFQRAALAGTVRIRRADIFLPDRTPAQVADLAVTEINGRGRPTPPPAAEAETGTGASDTVSLAGPQGPRQGVRVDLDLAVTADNQIYVSGRGLTAELKADLKVGGTAAAPTVGGTVSLVKGELALLGETFVLSKADLEFPGTTSLEPRLDVSARAEGDDVTAIVTLTGTPSKPSLSLSSDPELPEDEVLARLLFDRGIGQLSPGEAVQLAQSAAQLTGVIGGGPGVFDRVKRSLGVDRLELRGGENGESLGTIEAGRYIGSDIYLGVEQELETGQSRARLEYDVNRNIRLRGEVGRDSEVGVEFEWDY